MKTLKIVALAAVVGLAGVTTIWAQGDHGDGVTTTRLLMPIMNANRGMELFASKGCATCHAVNGVGGEDASPLDAHDMDEYMNPFDLAAKMWLMAPYMIAAQEDELGEQILFTGDELSNLIAFLHDDAQQKLFTEEFLEIMSADASKHGDGDGGHDDGEEEDHDEEEEEHDESETEEVHDDDEAPHD